MSEQSAEAAVYMLGTRHAFDATLTAHFTPAEVAAGFAAAVRSAVARLTGDVDFDRRVRTLCRPEPTTDTVALAPQHVPTASPVLTGGRSTRGPDPMVYAVAFGAGAAA